MVRAVRKKMEILPRNLPNLIRGAVKTGIRAILIVIAVELVVLIVACGITISVWIAKGFPAGLSAGIVTFLLVQMVASAIIHMSVLLEDRRREEALLKSEREGLEELRAELETAAKQPSGDNGGLAR